MILPVSISQRIMVLSKPPDARTFPSGLKATDKTISVCSLNVFIVLPVSIFQRIMFLSIPDARVFPSRLKATDLT